MALIVSKRRFKNKPPALYRPNLGHPQLKDLISAWYFQQGSGDIESVGPYNNPLDLNNTSWGAGGQGQYTGTTQDSPGTTGVKSQNLLLSSPTLGTDQTWVALLTPKSIAGHDIAVDGANRQLRIEILNGTWSAAIGSGSTWNSSHFATAGTPTIGRTSLVGVTNSPTDNARIHVFDETGYYTGDSSNSHASDETTQIYVGDIRTGSGFGFDGHIHALWWFEAILEPDRLREMWERPWAPFVYKTSISSAPSGPRIITGTGALQAQNAAVSGIGDATGAKTGSGALQAQSAAVSGVGSLDWEGTGALQAQNAAVSGAGAIVQTGAGILEAQAAAVSGIGELGAIKSGSGALQATTAAVAGDGLRIPVGSGALQAGAAAVSGLGTTSIITAGTGALQATPAAVTGQGEFRFDGAGALQAQPAAVTGQAFLVGDLTLTPADLVAIQEAVWAKLVNEGLVGQINELWQRRGLDPAAPQTYDKAGNQIRVGDITIDLSGDQNAVTQTRQP